MTVQLNKDSIDLGIVTQNPDKMLAFYRDTLGFEYEGEMVMPTSTMQRLHCGTSLIKLVTHNDPPGADAPPGGIAGATGYRYWTISVTNLNDITQKCADGGYTVNVQPREIRPGVRISMVEDPDGNWVEFIETT